MKAIMVMFDSLNRHMLPPYGCDWVHAPNFARLAEKTVVFDNAYVGSMPCMPARREIHTGRYNFLHRSWGPLEPFDDSMPAILGKNVVHTHLVSDHYHYWEDGGATYHTQYSTWEISRGQEGEGWKPVVGPFDVPENANRRGARGRQDFINRSYAETEDRQPQGVTFALGLEFLERNHSADRWFLQIETFDPHEPYFTQKKYKDLYPHKYDGPIWDWPGYERVTETPEQVRHMRFESAALHSMCDQSLGRVLDFMDAHDMWKDTMLIVNTDHGFLLGEHNLWAKCSAPFYNEVAHMPLFVWDPRAGARGARRRALVQTIDLAPTLLDFFGIQPPPDMQGVPLLQTVASDKAVRRAALFGLFGAHVNVTDGRYVYMRAAATAGNAPLYEYTLMPTHMRGAFSVDELRPVELAPPFAFTKGCRTMKIPRPARSRGRLVADDFGTALFDLQNDPAQDNPIRDRAAEEMMTDHLVRLMKENDAPPEQFERLGLMGR